MLIDRSKQASLRRNEVVRRGKECHDWSITNKLKNQLEKDGNCNKNISCATGQVGTAPSAEDVFDPSKRVRYQRETKNTFRRREDSSRVQRGCMTRGSSLGHEKHDFEFKKRIKISVSSELCVRSNVGMT